MSMGRSIKKIYPTGDKIKVWTNNSGLSAGMLNQEESLAIPFLSFYTRNSGGYILKISKEELDLIYSGDKAGYYQLKVSPFAFVVGEYVINMRWLDEHSVEDYKEVGITYEKLMEYSVETMFRKYYEEKTDEIMEKVNQLKGT